MIGYARRRVARAGGHDFVERHKQPTLVDAVVAPADQPAVHTNVGVAALRPRQQQVTRRHPLVEVVVAPGDDAPVVSYPGEGRTALRQRPGSYEQRALRREA